MLKRLIICFFAYFLIFAIISSINSLPSHAFDTIAVSFDGEQTFRELEKSESGLFREWFESLELIYSSEP